MDPAGNINVAVIGLGYWGPNLVRNFAAVAGTTVSRVCDLDQERLKKAKRLFPFVSTTTNLEDVLSDSNVDLIAVATPVSTHYELGMRALRAGKHVFIEKPLAGSSKLAGELVDFAKSKNLHLFVDHTFVF